MSNAEILNRVKNSLKAVYPDRLEGIVLYGSAARQQSRPDSDLDILVLLSGPVHYGHDLETNLQALYPLALELDRRISAKPVNAQEYDTLDCPLYQQAHREGIRI